MEVREDIAGEGFEASEVVVFVPAEHEALDTGFDKAPDLIDGGAAGADDADGVGGVLFAGFGFELSFHLRVGGAEEDAGHEGTLDIGRFAPVLLEEFVKAGVAGFDFGSGDGDSVPFVGVFGDEGEGFLLAVAADEDGRASGTPGTGEEDGFVQRVMLAAVADGDITLEQAGGDFEGVLEHGDAGRDIVEGDAELFVFAFVPADADAEHEASAAEIIDGGGHAGGEGGMAEGGGGDQRAEFDAAGVAGGIGEGNPRFERVEIRRADGVMVGTEDALEAEFFGIFEDTLPAFPIETPLAFDH